MGEGYFEKPVAYRFEGYNACCGMFRGIKGRILVGGNKVSQNRDFEIWRGLK